MAAQTTARTPGRIARSILAVLVGVIGVIRVLTDQVVDNVPIESFVTERVPDELEAFVPVLVGGVRNVVHEGFTRVLEDGRAREVLVATVERAHAAVMRVLEGLHVYRARLEGVPVPVRIAADIGAGAEVHVSTRDYEVTAQPEPAE